MILVKLPDLDASKDHRLVTTNLLYVYRKWLDEHAGQGPKLTDSDTAEPEWDWERGDRFARGVYIRDPEIAMLFKLRFGL